MKLTNITKCRECGGTSLTWDTVNRVNNAVQQGRLNTRDMQRVFFLGCDDCSETLAQISADTVASKLNASAEPSDCLKSCKAIAESMAEPSAPVERDERAEFELYRDRRNALLISEGSSAKWRVTQAHYATWEARAALEHKP